MSRMTNVELQGLDSASNDVHIRLCDEMALIRACYNRLDRLRANKQWIELASALSNLEWSAKNAGYAVNDIIRPPLETSER
jgi:hypothetical protein